MLIARLIDFTVNLPFCWWGFYAACWGHWTQLKGNCSMPEKTQSGKYYIYMTLDFLCKKCLCKSTLQLHEWDWKCVRCGETPKHQPQNTKTDLSLPRSLKAKGMQSACKMSRPKSRAIWSMHVGKTTVASLLFQKQVSLDAPGPTVMLASLACLKKTPHFLSLGEETITQEHLLNTCDTEYVTEHETAWRQLQNYFALDTTLLFKFIQKKNKTQSQWTHQKFLRQHFKSDYTSTKGCATQ